jgi:hypothetical protein
MSKITAEHLARSAIVYVRQSTSYQVANNLESQRRQYGLVERGHQLGWSVSIQTIMAWPVAEKFSTMNHDSAIFPSTSSALSGY